MNSANHRKWLKSRKHCARAVNMHFFLWNHLQKSTKHCARPKALGFRHGTGQSQPPAAAQAAPAAPAARATRAGSLLVLLLVRCSFCCLCCLCCSQHHRNRSINSGDIRWPRGVRSQTGMWNMLFLHLFKAPATLSSQEQVKQQKHMIYLKKQSVDISKNGVSCGGRQSRCNFNKKMRLKSRPQ